MLTLPVRDVLRPKPQYASQMSFYSDFCFQLHHTVVFVFMMHFHDLIDKAHNVIELRYIITGISPIR